MAEDQPQLTVKLANNPPNGDNAEYTESGNTIQVKRCHYPPDKQSAANFYEYKHTLKDSGAQKFTLQKVLGDNGKLIQIIFPKQQDSIPNVLSVSAYYWKHEKGGGHTPTKVLMIGVTTTGTKDETKAAGDDNTTTYYAKRGGDPKWHRFTFGSNLSEEQVEAQLDYRNCHHNRAVTINLYFVVSQNGPSDGKGNKYCCYYHYHRGAEKVTVEQKTVSCNTHRTSPIPYLKHTITDGKYSLAAIKFDSGGRNGKRKSITLNGAQFPISGVQSVSALYCKDGIPKVIYVEGGTDGVNGKWFKKDNGSREWTPVTNLQGKTPETINNSSDGKYEELVKTLTGTGIGHAHSSVTNSLLAHSVNTITTTFPPLNFLHLFSEETASQLQLVSSDDESEGNGLGPGDNTTAIIAGTVGGGIGTGLVGVGIWKGPAILARLIARL
ncbi:hypothetical protein BEWA_013570 [Theileria equi strain WA]|uniref:Uncharacterized protein n=1 Tax=Theileria equi strain WA TaxID=1537102 RepID=L1LCC4_THEEQ|nr:hypothetical protein BEWA_013570 [Theileria equi strain WA]EKX72798.1 hypothetical protein BEWA_013570 [Theileria equi strain WA]|eukprot:XP_004832250.1 hypothetical protein BEWA_013570 [Theileria equi strain WA]